MHGCAVLPHKEDIWICCGGSGHRTLRVHGMQMCVGMPQRTVTWMCCSGPGHRTLHVRGMLMCAGMPQRTVTWTCCSGPGRRAPQNTKRKTAGKKLPSATKLRRKAMRAGADCEQVIRFACFIAGRQHPSTLLSQLFQTSVIFYFCNTLNI